MGTGVWRSSDAAGLAAGRTIGFVVGSGTCFFVAKGLEDG